MVVMNISRSRKARIIARPRPSEEVVENTGGEASAGPSRIDTIKSAEAWATLPGELARRARERQAARAEAAAAAAEEVAFVPMPPSTPPPHHLRRELTPKLGSGVPKQLGSPPEKKGRTQ